MAAIVAIGFLTSLVGTVPASAVPSCAFANGTLTIADDVAAGLVYIDVWQDTNGQVWASATSEFAPRPPSPRRSCAGPVPLASVRSIVVSGGTAVDDLTIWMTQRVSRSTSADPSPWGPSAEWGKMDWEIDLGQARLNSGRVRIVAPVTDGLTLTGGDQGIDLNGDGDIDLTYTVLSEIDVLATVNGRGRNLISFAGDAATGGPLTIPVVIRVRGRSNDTLIGGATVDSISGGAGDDRIVGGAGYDGLRGDRGDDTIIGGGAHDLIRGGRGNDMLLGGGRRDQIEGGFGDDEILGGRGNDDIEGRQGSDDIHGGLDSDYIEGGRGPDRIFGGRGNDRIFGGRGRDFCLGGRGRDQVDCEGGG